jgi:GntR family transcriptional regulator/MocR family aminotransferase
MAPDSAAYVGTASKTLAPALRLAWMILPARLADAVTEAKRYADVHTASLGRLVLTDLIDTHAYDRHIRAARLRYQHRRDLLLTRLHAEAPRTRVGGIAAGLHAVIRRRGQRSPAGGSAARSAVLLAGLGKFAMSYHTVCQAYY